MLKHTTASWHDLVLDLRTEHLACHENHDRGQSHGCRRHGDNATHGVLSVSVSQDPVEDDVPPMDTFCVLVLDPTAVDHLQLRENERREHRSTVAEDGTRQWSVQNVNP